MLEANLPDNSQVTGHPDFEPFLDFATVPAQISPYSAGRVSDRIVFREQGASHRRDAGRYAVNPLCPRIARRLRGLASYPRRRLPTPGRRRASSGSDRSHGASLRFHVKPNKVLGGCGQPADCLWDIDTDESFGDQQQRRRRLHPVPSVEADFSDITTYRELMLTGINIPIRVGNTTVMPGDVVFGDSEGVYFIPPQFVEPILKQAEITHIHDEWTKAKFQTGKYKASELYPSPKDPALKKEFDEYLKKRLTQQ
jgi:hypothetical protein